MKNAVERVSAAGPINIAVTTYANSGQIWRRWCQAHTTKKIDDSIKKVNEHTAEETNKVLKTLVSVSDETMSPFKPTTGAKRACMQSLRKIRAWRLENPPRSLPDT